MLSRTCALLFLMAFMLIGRASAQGDAEAAVPAENDPLQRPHTLSVMAHFPWYYNFGVGAVGRYELPIAPAGFLHGVNDQVSVEPSLGVAYASWSYGNDYDYNFAYIAPAVYGVWSFYLQEDLRLYGGLGLGYGFGVYSGDLPAGATINHFYWDVVGGLFYRFTSVLSLRAELGYEGPKVGLALEL